jgi:hypothetical protein
MELIGWRASFRPSTQDVAAALRDDGIRHAYADYFLAYKLAFESDGDVQVAPFGAVRDHAEANAVRAAPRVAYVFSVGDGGLQRARDGLDRLGVDYEEQVVGRDYVVLEPSEPVRPEELDPAPLGF